jgi:hypothetical protein
MSALRDGVQKLEKQGSHEALDFAVGKLGHRRREIGGFWRARFNSEMAEEVGFEPTVRFHARRFSRPVP